MKDINNHLSLTLKTLRIERGWSLDKAAAETGVSKAMLGQIERKESSPTIATLWKIASGFHTSFSSLIEKIDLDSKKLLYRTGKTKQLHPHNPKIRVMPLFPFDEELHFEIFAIELLPGCEHLSPPHENGVIEHAIVVQGAIEILVDGVWRSLKKSSGLRFHANQAHGYRNVTTKIARFYDMIHYK